MAIHRLLDGLFLVDLDLPREGFRRFIASWVLRRGSSALVVDPGPTATIPTLLRALEELGVERLAGVLLTHIHVDHAGGTGLLLERYPDARVVCHPKGSPHLVDPTRLWEGSRKILGDLAEAYGPIAPVPRENLTFDGALVLGPWNIDAVETPGHAPHHVAYRAGEVVFGGEVAGVRLEFPSGVYQRPATPPVFLPDVFQASIDRVAELGPSRLCLGHYGLTDRPRETLRVARAQIETWLTVVERHSVTAGDGGEAAIFAELLDADPHFGLFRELPPDVQTRERYFAGNSIAGMRGALASRLTNQEAAQPTRY